jgi:L-threonylcarbamoyladenylate synthase
VLRVDPRACTLPEFEPAVAWLKQGGVVAYPTDTFYGLAVDPTSAKAVAGLFDLKGRQAAVAVPFIAASRAQVDGWSGLSELGARLADQFWPGPLSLICAAPKTIVHAAIGGGDTVAVRVPDHAVARALAYAWGAPITATSANRTGQPPATTAEELKAIASPALFIIDAGPTPGGSPSTIVDARGAAPPILLREGAIAWSDVLHSLKG